MPKLNGRIPKYRPHKASGQGIVTLDGQDHYCGPYRDPASKIEYDRLVTIWLANGRKAELDLGEHRTISVNELIVRFWDHAQAYYRKPDGSVAREVEMYRQAVKPLIELFGETSVDEFGPLRLKAVRSQMIKFGWCRNHVNHQVSRLKSMFRWGTEEELVSGPVCHALQAVKGLRRGRGEAVESDPVRPAPEAYVNAINTFVSRQVWALVQLQLLTGARPGELVALRPIDLDTTGEIWTCSPAEHKTAYRGHSRRIYLGPKAKRIVQDFLENRPTHAYLFSPEEAERERREQQSRNRKTPMSCGNRPGTNRTPEPKISPGGFYDVAAYRRAVSRACDLAFPPPVALARVKIGGIKGERSETRSEWKARLGSAGWAELKKWRKAHCWHPHQLRHNAATRVRKERGIDAARALLGHRSLVMTDVYAELDHGLAASVVSQIG